ncbi:hypothetical protein DENSPDRAFT_886781 [Dentipellis sp. KUC8613]|nr:hypothetical protein DENSPDRAFT_886781 [Dentipellis sp. KUC8613]
MHAGAHRLLAHPRVATTCHTNATAQLATSCHDVSDRRPQPRLLPQQCCPARLTAVVTGLFPPAPSRAAVSRPRGPLTHSHRLPMPPHSLRVIIPCPCRPLACGHHLHSPVQPTRRCTHGHTAFHASAMAQNACLVRFVFTPRRAAPSQCPLHPLRTAPRCHLHAPSLAAITSPGAAVIQLHVSPSPSRAPPFRADAPTFRP